LSILLDYTNSAFLAYAECYNEYNMLNAKKALANLRSQTGVATFVQLAAVTFFVVIAGVTDLVKNCDVGSSCVANSFLWIIIVFMVALWFFILSGLGYAVQMKRSRRLAKLLILAELFTAGIAFMIVSHPSGPLSLIGGLVTLLIALGTALMAFRVHQAKGGRVVNTPGGRQRRARKRLSS
jgi:hypothetical protein